MTTLEKAARAAYDSYATVLPVTQPWEGVAPEQRELAFLQARAVLLAVLPELKRYSECDSPGMVSDDQGDYVLYDDLTAILADGGE